jgi:GDP-4-dehydro-6-deoxy-D-mannose reductase
VSEPVVLVTGAGGFAGSHLLEHLAGSADLVGWSRSEPAKDLATLARWQRVDLLDRHQVTDALSSIRPSRIFHCAGLPHVAESWVDTAAPLAANVLGTHRLLEALERLGLRCRLLVTSSAQVYAPSTEPITEDQTIAPSSPYALSKLAQEQLALRAATGTIEVIVSRPFNHTGPRQKPAFLAPTVARQIAMIERGLLEPVLKVGNMVPSRDVMDVRDAVRAYAAIMKSGTPGTIYNVASGVGRPVRTIVEALVARSRVPVRIEQDPSRFRPSDVPVFVGSSRRLQQATGWRPEISFEKMIDDLLDYWRQFEALQANIHRN